MSRGYGNRRRYEGQSRQMQAAAAQVAVASTSATVSDVSAGIPSGLEATLNNYEERIFALENPV